MKANGKETRFTAEPVTTDGGRIRGYAAVYGKLSEDLGGFREVLAPGCFDAADRSDVKCLFNHDMNLILGRSKTGRGTLRIGLDARGLWYEVDLPDTNAGRDLKVSLERGDVDQSSFGFAIKEDRWTKSADGTPLRTILKVARLFDCSPVCQPAYPDTSVALVRLKRSGMTPTTRATRSGESLSYHEARLRLVKLNERRQKLLHS